MTRILMLAAMLVLVAAAPAKAEPVELTAQAKAANAAFLLHAAPPAPAATICLVDTGVNLNPDTAGVLTRVSPFGLDGSDQSPSLHGTRMAMLMGAASNGFGMVGMWPSARIVSVQSNNPGQDAFAAMAYMRGIAECSSLADVYGIKVTVVPVASEVPLTEAEQRALQLALSTARSRGINVVAAAGNFSGRTLGVPANFPGVFSVGASDAATGSLCSTSATGALLLAPGCSIDGADPVSGAPLTSQSGTSAAAVLAATALAALRTWRPDLTPDAAERLLNETGTAAADGRQLNLAATFTAAGLGAVVQPAPPPAPTPALAPPAAKPRLPKPRFSVRLRRKVLTVRIANRPARMTARVRVYARGKKGKVRRTKSVARRASVIRVRTARWTRVTVRLTDRAGALSPSPATTVKKRR